MSKYVAKCCKLGKILDNVGDVLHHDDLEKVRSQVLGVSKEAIGLLFEEIQ